MTASELKDKIRALALQVVDERNFHAKPRRLRFWRENR
jgi:hypothetical protein